MCLKVNRKHERLQTEMERISSVLPQVAAAAGRAKEALVDPVMRMRNNRQIGDASDYDRQVSDVLQFLFPTYRLFFQLELCT